jgi:hypothetical protein
VSLTWVALSTYEALTDLAVSVRNVEATPRDNLLWKCLEKVVWSKALWPFFMMVEKG